MMVIGLRELPGNRVALGKLRPTIETKRIIICFLTDSYFAKCLIPLTAPEHVATYVVRNIYCSYCNPVNYFNNNATIT